MKTLTVNYREQKATYKGDIIFDCKSRSIREIEDIAEDKGYTHIRWLRLPIGSGNTKSVIRNTN